MSMLASDVLNRATTFVVYALVARYLGAYAVGQLALALTLFYTFYVFATAGVKTLIGRQVAKDKAATDHYLVGGSLLVSACSALSFAALLGFLWLMHYRADTTLVISVMALGLLPASLSLVCESVMWAWERMHLIAFSTIPVSIGKVVACFIILSRRARAVRGIVALVLCRVALATIEWCLLLWCVLPSPPGRRSAAAGGHGAARHAVPGHRGAGQLQPAMSPCCFRSWRARRKSACSMPGRSCSCP